MESRLGNRDSTCNLQVLPLLAWAKNQALGSNSGPLGSEVRYPRIAIVWASVRGKDGPPTGCESRRSLALQ